MKGPLRVINAGEEGVRLTIGPVWADLPREVAVKMWQELGQQLGILCGGHRLGEAVIPSARCSRCGSLVELAEKSK